MNFATRLSVAALLASATGLASAQTVLTVASFKDLDRSVQAAIPLYKKIHPEVEIKLVALGYATTTTR